MRNMSIMRQNSADHAEPRFAPRPAVVLRADAGSSIGYGHFVRTVALAAYLSRDFDCRVASRNPDNDGMTPYQLALVAEAGARPVNLPMRGREPFDEAFLGMISPGDVVVLDNYYYDTDYQTRVKSRCRALVCIDDVHDRHFVSDVVMTFCPLSRDCFSLDADTRFFGGIGWSFLRAPFLETPLPEWRVRARLGDNKPGHAIVRRVAMAMGGADPFRLTGKIVAMLRELSPGLEIDVLAGDAVRMDSIPDSGVRVHRKAGAAEITDIFDHADLGIFPASTVCVEAFSRRLPVAAGHYVGNQKEFYDYGVREGWFRPLGSLLDADDILFGRLRRVLNMPLPEVPEFDFRARRDDIVRLFHQLSFRKNHDNHL